MTVRARECVCRICWSWLLLEEGPWDSQQFYSYTSLTSPTRKSTSDKGFVWKGSEGPAFRTEDGSHEAQTGGVSLVSGSHRA